MIDCRTCSVLDCKFNSIIPKKSCSMYKPYNLTEHDKQIRADMISEFKNFIRNNKHYFVGDMAELLIYEFEQMQVKEHK